ncbi:MAG: metal-dependent phosphohydrolase [Actinomycetota bacterium]
MSDGADFGADLRRLVPDLDPTLAEDLWAELVAAHAGDHRRYHTLAHARLVRDNTVGLGAAAGVDDPVVAIAAWYHDAVYVGLPGDDERASADLASAVAERIGRGDVADRLRTLILTTIDHRPVDEAAAVLVDADLAILAASPLDYERYRRRVRAEYGHVADDDWRRGRAAVLRSLLGRDRLFHSPGGRGREPAARRNLLTELTRTT